MHPFMTLFSLKIPSYGVMMMLGVLVAGALGMLRVRRAGLRWENAIVLLACGYGVGLLGATALYVLVSYRWQELVEMLRSGALFTQNRLGLVFYGGLIGAIPGGLLGARLAHIHLGDYVPSMLPCIPLGHAFGRVGCLLAGCCYGVPTSLPLGVVYRNPISDVPEGIPLFPVQALESLLLLGIFVVLLLYARRANPARQIVGLYLLLYSACRFGLEYLRYDQIRGRFGLFSTSQWISAGLFAVGAMCFMKGKEYRTR